MHIGLGLYKSILTKSNLRFARQAGATHIVAQLVDYIKGGDSPDLTRDYLDGWGVTHPDDEAWSYDGLVRLRKHVESQGLTLGAIENFDPGHWYDILLDGPKRQAQIDTVKQIIQSAGKAGIPTIGYYFSIAGVWGWRSTGNGRGDAKSIEFDASNIDVNRPIPAGMVWNMTYDENAVGTVPSINREELWDRYSRFLDEVIPVAEEAGVRLVAHPDDPPLAEMRGSARLFHSHESYREVFKGSDSKAHGFEFCLGTLQEMKGGDVYSFLEESLKLDRIGYIHFRNVKGKVPHYREVFVDEGDLDMVRVMQILKKYDFKGIIIPDHTPEMTCNAPWHAGMAYALGYIKGVMQSLDIN